MKMPRTVVLSLTQEQQYTNSNIPGLAKSLVYAAQKYVRDPKEVRILINKSGAQTTFTMEVEDDDFRIALINEALELGMSIRKGNDMPSVM